MSEHTIDQLPFDPSDLSPEAPYINEAVLKVHSRCNLDCDYCYVYNLGNDSWRDQPKLMSDRTIETFAGRLAEYLQGSDQFIFTIVLHGGEPLLAPPEYFDKATRTIRSAVDNKTVLRFEMQTNGARLNSEYLDVFRKHRIGLGVSLDGNREAQDRHRLTRGGHSSYDDTVRGIRLMSEDNRYKHLFLGILAVVDIKNDPVETYRSLREFDPPSIDFLLPHGNWQTPPPGLEAKEQRLSAPYGAWLKTVFDTWFPDETEQVRIRTFDSMVHLYRGGRSLVESVGGLADAGLVVVETDGSYELVDTLKSAPGNVAKTGKNIYRHSFSEANEHMARKARSVGALTLAQTCQKCPLLEQCGGGYTPHRFHPSRGFANRSVYCQDLANIITHIGDRLMVEAKRYVSDDDKAV